MNILYLDIDSLRPDHLGCYGYHRDTSPNIDKIASQGVRFGNCYATDVPCLPSRTAMFQCRHGIHTGVIDHGGDAADMFPEGPGRGFRGRVINDSFPMKLRNRGYYTGMISPFGERHSALQIWSGFNEILNPGGKGGNEVATEVTPAAVKWIREKSAGDQPWFLHLNVWDPHTPYRSPDELIASFKDDPLPEWYSEEVRQKHWDGCGPHSAQEVNGFEPGTPWTDRFPNQPKQMTSLDEVRRMFDGYDAGVRFADQAVGELVALLEELGIRDETAIVVTADHGENLGELNIYGDHQTADLITTRIPMVVHWPGVTDARAGQLEDAFIHHFDIFAGAVDITGGKPGQHWDARSAKGLMDGSGDAIRDWVVVSQGSWSCQRGVRFDDYMLVRSYHDGYHDFPDYMLFNVVEDPHEQHNLAEDRPDLVARGCHILDQWLTDMMRTATHAQDPMWTVVHAGGAHHTRGKLPPYLERLRATGRGAIADRLEAKHPKDLHVQPGQVWS